MTDELTDEWLRSLGGQWYQSYDGNDHTYFQDDHDRVIDVYVKEEFLTVSLYRNREEKKGRAVAIRMDPVKTQADFVRVCELFRFELPKPQEATAWHKESAAEVAS